LNKEKQYVHEVLSGDWRVSWWKSLLSSNFLQITLRYKDKEILECSTKFTALTSKIDLNYLGKKLISQLTAPNELNSSVVKSWALSKASGVEL